MRRVHFYEALERKVDFEHEYIKLENMCREEYYDSLYLRSFSINTWIDGCFRKWDKRTNYTSYNELRSQLGFMASTDTLDEKCISETMSMNNYFLFCEMIINLITDLGYYSVSALDNVTKELVETIQATIEKLGFTIKRINGELLVVEKMRHLLKWLRKTR